MLPAPAMTTRRTLACSDENLLHHQLHVLARGDEEDLVVLLDRRVALGIDAAAAAIDRRDPDLEVGNVRAQRLQLVADELAALQRAHADEQHAAVRELEHLQGARIADQALDVVGDELLRADREVDRDRVLAEQLRRGRSSRRERMRAILVGVRNSVQAIWQAIMLTSSL